MILSRKDITKYIDVTIQRQHKMQQITEIANQSYTLLTQANKQYTCVKVKRGTPSNVRLVDYFVLLN